MMLTAAWGWGGGGQNVAVLREGGQAGGLVVNGNYNKYSIHGKI